RLVAEGHNITATTNFCGVGVIGAADIADSGLSDSDPEFGYDGDRVVIMSNLPVTAPQDCQSLVQTGLSGRTLPLAFAVEMAKPDELVLSSQTIGSVSASFERVAECFGELVQFAVTARDAYLVKGDRSGVRHRVIEENGRCLVDRALDVRHQMRAFSGVVYTNGALSFKLAQPKAAVPEGEEVNVYFPLRELLRPITIDAGASNIRNTAAGDGTLPSFIRFSTSNQRLYTVDSALSGVVQFDVTPLAAESFFE
ncbi:MAG: hypothetical protein H6715_06480, partial [Myxococcales bacterium]|nr:hypothetical protein [Myxococcales bacterium]